MHRLCNEFLPCYLQTYLGNQYKRNVREVIFKLTVWNENLNENFLLDVMGVTVVFLSIAGGICGGRNVTGRGLLPSTSVFLCQYHSNNAVHSNSSLSLVRRTRGRSLGIF